MNSTIRESKAEGMRPLFLFLTVFTLSTFLSVCTYASEQDKWYECRSGRKIEIGKYVRDRQHGLEPRYFQFTVSERGDYQIFYQLDDYGVCVMALLDGNCRVVDEGAIRLRETLEPGTYYLAVRGSFEHDKTKYRIFVIPDPSGYVTIPFSRSINMIPSQVAEYYFDVQEAGEYLFSADSRTTSCGSALFTKSKDNKYTEVVGWEYVKRRSFKKVLPPDTYSFFMSAEDHTEYGLVAVRISRTSTTIEGAQDLYASSINKEITDEYQIDIDRWLAPPPGELPYKLGTVELGNAVTEDDVADWKLVKTGGAFKAYETQLKSGDLARIIVEENKIVGISYTITTKPIEFRDKVVEYAKAKFGKHQMVESTRGEVTYISFAQGNSEAGTGRTLTISYLKHIVNIEIFLTDRALAAQALADTGGQTFVAESKPPENDLYPRIHEWFGSPSVRLPRNLGGIALGEKFNPGDKWKQVGTEAGLAVYKFTHENGNWNLVKVSPGGEISFIEVMTLSPSQNSRDSHKRYVNDKFSAFLKSKSEGGTSYNYYFQEPSGGIIDPISLEIAVPASTTTLTIRLFYGDR
jgi:hypothetical protein